MWFAEAKRRVDFVLFFSALSNGLSRFGFLTRGFQREVRSFGKIEFYLLIEVLYGLFFKNFSMCCFDSILGQLSLLCGLDVSIFHILVSRQ